MGCGPALPVLYLSRDDEGAIPPTPVRPHCRWDLIKGDASPVVADHAWEAASTLPAVKGRSVGSMTESLPIIGERGRLMCLPSSFRWSSQRPNARSVVAGFLEPREGALPARVVPCAAARPP